MKCFFLLHISVAKSGFVNALVQLQTVMVPFIIGSRVLCLNFWLGFEPNVVTKVEDFHL
jgi:hypothetical protein